MEVVIVAAPVDAADVVAGVVVDVLRRRPAPEIGLATGSSPLGAHHRFTQGLATIAPARHLVLDNAAAPGLAHAEHYRAVSAGRPAWQVL